MVEADGVVAAIASRQHGAVRRQQAHQAGLSNAQLRRRVDSGALCQPHPSVFVVNGAPATFRQRLAVATLSVVDASASHESAARQHHVEPLPPERIVVTVPHGGSRRAAADHVHRTRFLPERHVTVIDGITTTTLPRTLIDLASVVGTDRLALTLDNCVSARRVDVGELVAEFHAMAVQGRRGLRVLRRLLEERSDGLAVPASVLERATLDLIAAHGLPAPVAQWSPPWGGTLIGRIDLAYLEQQVVVEVDGRRWHTRVADFEVDHRRDQLAVMAGWRVLRFTWNQVTRRPDEVAVTLATVIRGRGSA